MGANGDTAYIKMVVFYIPEYPLISNALTGDEKACYRLFHVQKIVAYCSYEDTVAEIVREMKR